MQALEYKSFLRFRVAKILDDLCANQLQPLLLKTLLNRAEGALLINAVGVDDVKQADEMVKLATAVAHLIGRSNFDAMSGQYYARFVVKNVDNSDSYLRQPHRVMELQRRHVCRRDNRLRADDENRRAKHAGRKFAAAASR